jgi:AcrR family transcriptional regulator
MRGNGDTKGEIAKTALRLFCQCGFEGTSMRDLAGELGVTPAAIYYHFKEKSDILVQLVAPLVEDFDELVTDPPDGTGPAGVRVRLAALVRLLLRHRQVVQLIVSDVSARSHPAVQAAMVDFNGGMAELLTGGEPDVRQRLRAAAALGALFRPIIWMDPEELAPLEDELVAAAAGAFGLPKSRQRSTKR